MPGALLKALETADLIVHLGDFTRTEVIDLLRTFAPLRGVQGNNDDADVCALYPTEDYFTIGYHRFALLHGHLGGKTALDSARKVRGADAVLFGHSHVPYIGEYAGALLFNPGSPTDRRWSAYPAFGILDVDEVIAPRIVPVSGTIRT
ncbi:MAG: metallophosphoesterase [Chloroflexota bacterium]